MLINVNRQSFQQYFGETRGGSGGFAAGIENPFVTKLGAKL